MLGEMTKKWRWDRVLSFIQLFLHNTLFGENSTS